MIQYHVVRKNLVNVQVWGKDSCWYVEKRGNWYHICWGNINNLLDFRLQSWFASQDKTEIKEKLAKSVFSPVEVVKRPYQVDYVYQS